MKDLGYKFSELVDIPALQEMLDNLHTASQIPSAIIDMEGNILTWSGGERICEEFYRKNPEAEKACIQSDIQIHEEISQGKPYAIYKCPHGLVDSCAPVIIEGHHVANVFTGQMLHTPLNDEIIAKHKELARKYGFDEDQYLDALRQVRVFPIEKHRYILDFLAQLARQISQMGLNNLRALEQKIIIAESQELYRNVFLNNHSVMFIVDPETANFVDANPAACAFYGYSREEFSNKKITDINPLSIEEIKADLATARDKKQHHFYFQHRLADGTDKDVEVYSGPIIRHGRQLLLSIVHDITKESRLNKALAKNEQLLQGFLDNATVAIYLKDIEHKYLLVNKRFEALTHISQEQFLGKNDYDLFPPEIADLFRAQDIAVISRQQSLEFAETITLPDGEFSFITAKFPLYDDTGNMYAVGGICTDITAQKKSELARNKSEKRFRAFLDQASDAIFVCDLDANLTLVNKQACESLGYSQAELLDMTVADVDPLFAKQDHPRKIWSGLTPGKTIATESIHQRKDGSTFPVEINIGLIEMDDSRAILGITRDISARQELEKSLQRSREEWERTFDAMEDIITIQDVDMHIIRANMAFHKAFKSEPGTLNGKFCYEVFRGKNTPCQNCPELETLDDMGCHTATITHENLGRTFSVTTAPVFDENGDFIHIVHIARDITDIKKLESELFQAHKMEAIGTLAGGIAHDFNNMLAAIIGYADLAKYDLPAASNSMDCLDQVLKASHRAKDLVKQILTFSRKNPDKLSPINPAPILKEAVKLLHSSLPSTIDIQTDMDSDCGTIMANPTNLHQVLVNLCTNAFHAMDNEQGELKISLGQVELSANDLQNEKDTPPGRYIELMVSDSGRGMNGETLSHIFEPYYTTKAVGKGSGMGLALVLGIVRGSNGFIKVKSTPGQGSIFRVYWPAVAKDIPPADTSSQASEILPGGHERILAVDDDQAIVNMYRITLQRLGYEVTTFGDSQQALAAFTAHPTAYDIIITDQTMPRLPGSELSKKILQIRADIPIILCTGYSSMISEEEAKCVGIKEFLMKPVSKQTLATAVRKILDAGDN